MGKYSFQSNMFRPHMAVDTAFLIDVFEKPGNDNGLSKALWDEMVSRGVWIVIPAPAFAELIVKNTIPIPRTPEVSVEAFDEDAANLLTGKNEALRNVQDSGHAHHIIRADAMIAATAIRHNCKVLVSADSRPDMAKVCAALGLDLQTPLKFLEPEIKEEAVKALSPGKHEENGPEQHQLDLLAYPPQTGGNSEQTHASSSPGVSAEAQTAIQPDASESIAVADKG